METHTNMASRVDELMQADPDAPCSGSSPDLTPGSYPGPYQWWRGQCGAGQVTVTFHFNQIREVEKDKV